MKALYLLKFLKAGNINFKTDLYMTEFIFKAYGL